MTSRITRSSTCVSLHMPSHLACDKCKDSIERSEMNGSQPRISKRCLKPWDDRWGMHREKGKVLHYTRVCEHLQVRITDEEYFLNSCVNTKLKSTCNEKEAPCAPLTIPDSPSENIHPLVDMSSPPTIPDDIARSEPEIRSNSVPDTIRERGGNKC